MLEQSPRGLQTGNSSANNNGCCLHCGSMGLAPPLACGLHRVARQPHVKHRCAVAGIQTTQRIIHDKS
jgi:hypothetical protein